MTGSPPPPPQRARARDAAPRAGPAPLGWTLAAILVFLAASAALFAGFRAAGLGGASVLPARDVYEALAQSQEGDNSLARWDRIAHNDLRFVTWLISRNARTLVTRPARLFDAEPCYPSARSLALGEPGISLGALAIPGQLLTGNPIAAFNWALVSLPFLSGLAMFLLVRDWSGSPAAGITAGLLYGFHPIKTWDVIHPYVWDTGWTVLALWFAVRLFADRRWRDALGLAACIALQIGGSFYALLSAAVIALPFVAWLAWRHGLSRSLLLRLGLCAALVLPVAWLILGPYLELRSAGVLQARQDQMFVPLRWVLPDGFLFPGWLLLGLGALGLLAGGARCLRLAGDPRWALAAACGLLFLLSTVAPGHPGLAGPERTANLYTWLASFLPGLDVIRSPASLYSGTHLTLCILAGFGCAALVRSGSGRLGRLTGIAAIVVALASLLAQGLLAPAAHGFRFVSVAPDPDSLRFFEALESQGNAGPLLEIPIPPQPEAPRVTRSILLAAYHGRPTSECRNSFTPPELDEARRIAKALPSLAAVRSARRLGFTTIVVHHASGAPFGGATRRQFERFLAAHPDGPLLRVQSDAAMTAYAIDPAVAEPRSEPRGRAAG